MSRRHLTASGRFEVKRKRWDTLTLWHVGSGLPCGRFSHLSVRTFKAAVEGVERVEAATTADDLALIDLGRSEGYDTARAEAGGRFIDAMRAAFPNGAWSR